MIANERIDLGLKDSAEGCSCCATASAPTMVPTRSRLVANVLVDGMTCSHCVKSVTDEIMAIDGVEGVSVDLKTGAASRVTIHSEAPIDLARVQTAVEEAGYVLASSAG